MSKRNAILGSVVALAFLASCSANESAGSLATPTPEPSQAGAASVAPSEAASSAPSSYAVGDRIKLGEEEFFGVSEVNLAVPGGDVFKPDPGNKWIAALVEIEGINPNGATYNPFFFKVRDEQGFEYSIAFGGKEPVLQSSNDLPPGTKVKGWVTFEVPATATTFTLVYAPGFASEPAEVALN